MSNNTLDELYDRVSDLYKEVGSFKNLSSSYGTYLNDTDNFVNDLYKNAISKICNIDVSDVTYDMVALARGYTVSDESSGYRRYRHLNNDELREQIGIIRGDVSSNERVNDRINKLYDMIDENRGKLRELGIPEEDISKYMNDLSIDIFKNTISTITGLNPIVIPDNFANSIYYGIKEDKNGNVIFDKYTDSEIVLKAKKEGLYDKTVYLFPREYNHATAGDIERLDHAINSHYKDLEELGLDRNNSNIIMNSLTDSLYVDALSNILEIAKEDIDDEFVKKVRGGKTLIDGRKRSYFDNEIKLLYEYDKSKNKTR
jgi:hypothetical protein